MPISIHKKVNLAITMDYFSAQADDLQRHFREIAVASGEVKFFTRKEIKYLPQFINQGESIIRFSSGTIGVNTWLLVLTNIRIVFVNVGMIYGVQHTSIFLDKITAISGKEGLVLGKIYIRDGAGDRVIDNVSKQSVANFVKAAQIAIENVKNAQVDSVEPHEDKYDRLKKLYNLKEIGAISQAEYEIEKMRLLG